MDKLIALIAQRFYREMAGVIAPSRGISDDLRRCGNVHVIPNPVYVPSSNKIFQHPRPFALGVGRLCEQKRFSDLLEDILLFDSYIGISEGETSEGETNEIGLFFYKKKKKISLSISQPGKDIL